MTNWLKLLIGLVPILVINSGCTNLTTFPSAARAGDTVVLGVGSQTRMTKGNTQVFYTPQGQSAISIPNANVRAIMKLYADKTSQAYSQTNPNVVNNFGFLHHDTWQTVIVVDLPAGLPVGPGDISFTTTVPKPVELEPTPLLDDYPDLNVVTMPLEIVAGTGVSNPFDFATTSGGSLPGNVALLRPQRQAEIRPPVADPTSAWTSTFGAIEFTVDLSGASDPGGLTEDSIRLVAQDVSMFTKSKAQMTWALNGTDLTVIYISVTGNMQYYEPLFSIVGETADFPVNPTITAISYYDIDGNSASGPGISDYTVEVYGLLP